MKASSLFCSSLVFALYSKSIVLAPLQNFFDLRPAQFGEQRRAGARVARMLARRGPVHHALGDALADGGDAEQAVGHVVVPYRRLDALATGALEVHVNILALGRDAQFRQRQAL